LNPSKQGALSFGSFSLGKQHDEGGLTSSLKNKKGVRAKENEQTLKKEPK
jgi:hypothetical protein